MPNVELSVTLLLPEKIRPDDIFEFRKIETERSQRIHEIAFLVKELLRDASLEAGIFPHMHECVERPRQAMDFEARANRIHMLSMSDLTVVFDPGREEMQLATKVPQSHLSRVLAVFSNEDALLGTAADIAHGRIPLAEEVSDPQKLKALPRIFGMQVPAKIVEAKKFHDRNIAVARNALVYPEGPTLDIDRETWFARE